MAYYERNIDGELLKWKASVHHKPILLRGARQVGKSSSVRRLGECFEHFVEINFERQPQMAQLFKSDLSALPIVSSIASLVGKPIVAGKTLLFFDEIQQCPEAISALRYFWEDMPDLHIIAAGSLLEFTLQDISSFGVGRIHSLYMYPLSFDEFIRAQGFGHLLEAKRGASVDNPLPELLHEKLVDLFRIYIMVGGMPEAVATWIDTHDYLSCQRVHAEIVQAYEVDFGKYGKKVNPSLLRQTLRSVVHQIGSKFVYSHVGQDIRSSVVKEALDLLRLAGLIIPVYATTGNGFPLGTGVSGNIVKYLYIDSGLLLAILSLDMGNISELTEQILLGTAPDLVNKGSLTEMSAGLEIIKYMPPERRPELYYWVKEARNSLAEVDYVMMKSMKILPIEVKAGRQGGMKSLYTFMELKNITGAVRTSLENFGVILRDKCRIEIFPLYALANLRDFSI